jgi:FkbM family methyltransferase
VSDAPRPNATTVDHDVALAWFESRRPTYERLAQSVEPFIDQDGVILDVGGNIGFFTKVVTESTGFTGTVHVFEPVPNLAELCARTLAEVPYTAIIHNFGLGEEASTFDLYVGGDGNLGWNTLIAAKANASMKVLRIDVRPLSDVPLDKPPCFVKIDVEGAEYLVLRGMLSSLKAWTPRPTILCEIGWGATHPSWAEELAVFDELAALGYTACDLDQQPIDVRALTKTTDVLFVPSHS